MCRFSVPGITLSDAPKVNCRNIPITLTDLNTRRFGHDQALAKVMQHLLKDDTQVYKQFVENDSFRRFVGDMVYQITSQGL